MERVQYQLERSVPQLQLLDENNVFTKEQLRSITTQRQTFEARLLRRGPDKQDFLRYAEFERNLADLINVKANRIGLPRAFHRDNAAAHTGHIIAIYERLVLKFKYDVDAWQQYIAFAKSRKMRVVTGRVYARALSLHPNNVPLWLSAAAHELNDNASTTAARSLLQRALRINHLPWKQTCSHPDASSSRNKRASSREAHDSTKRPRYGAQMTQSDEDASSDGKGAASGPAVLRFSSREADLLRLWVEYIRMELVFIERLRRRWLVLGLQWDTDSAEQANPIPSEDTAEAVQAAIDIDAETRAGHSAAEEADDEVPEHILLDQVPDKDVDAQPEVAESTEVEPNTFTPRKLSTIPPTQVAILQGNIPLFLIGSALEDLAPHLHFVLLLALIDLLHTFPFAEPVSLNAPKSGQALRRRLLNGVYQHLSNRQRWSWHNFAPAALASSLRSFRPETSFFADKSEETAAQAANAEEMDSHRLLMSASHLRTTFSHEMDGLLELASQLNNTASSDVHKASVWLSSSLAVQLVLQLLQSLLTEKVHGGRTRPSPAFRRLAATGELQTAVNAALTQLHTFCVQAPMDRTRRTGRSAKSEFYTTTALLIGMLSDEQRSGIDEPNLLHYLDSMQAQLSKEAQAAGPEIETAQIRAVTLRKKVDAALAFEDAKERDRKLTKLKEQLKQATSASQFPGSDELWSLRISVTSQLARTSGKTVEESRDCIAAEWRRGLQACSEVVDVEALTLTAEMSLWSRFFAWLDHGVVGSQSASRKELKTAFRYSSDQYRWAVRETASLLSRSNDTSFADLEAVHQHRQAVHDLCVLRYVRLSASLGKLADTLTWLLQFSFATHRAWLQIVSELATDDEEGGTDSERTPMNAQLVDKIFAKLLQVKPSDVEVWISYLQHLAGRDMIKALQRLETCRSTLQKSEYKLVEKGWQRICEQLQGGSTTSINDSDEAGSSVERI